MDGDAAEQHAESNAEPLPAGLICPECHYDLRGLTSDRCPECGYSLAGVREGRSLIPWVNRADRGRFLAYWLTVVMVTIHGRDFANEIIRPVPFEDARLFRRLTVLHAYVVLLAGSIVALVRWWDEAVAFFGPLTIPWFVAQQAALFLTLLAITALPRCFFHPRRMSIPKQNRAIALSYYTCGVLAWLVVVAAVAGFWWLTDAAYRDFELYAAVVTLACGVILLRWWLGLLRLSRRGLRAGLLRVLLLAVGAPVLCTFVGVLIMVAIPATVLYIAIMVQSLLRAG